jgi:MFS family permease
MSLAMKSLPLPASPAVQGSVHPLVVALAGMASLAVAMGIGRFAFTPLLPMMLHDGVLDLAQGSWLATANYLGYLLGAFMGMALPWVAPKLYAVWNPARITWTGLIATLLLTAAMAFAVPQLWPTLRFFAGMASALTFLGTSSWCMVRLAGLGRPALSGLIFCGPGLGILLTGLFASAMVAAQWHASSGWWMFTALALVLCVLIWPLIQGPAALHGEPPAPGAPQPQVSAARTIERPAELSAEPVAARVVHALGYGLAGFGYIITATFLPVIARTVMPADSGWADLFWPIAGAGAVVGILASTRLPVHWSRRSLLAGAYLMQAAGIGLGLLWPTTAGFAIGSVLVGLPFNAITFFGIQEARRSWPASADSFVGMITGLYGLGQIAGPPLVAWLLVHSPEGSGFERGLECAALSLVIGAALYLASLWLWPEHREGRQRR